MCLYPICRWSIHTRLGRGLWEALVHPSKSSSRRRDTACAAAPCQTPAQTLMALNWPPIDRADNPMDHKSKLGHFLSPEEPIWAHNSLWSRRAVPCPRPSSEGAQRFASSRWEHVPKLEALK